MTQTLTRRHRLGYAWNNQARRHPETDRLYVPAPTRPEWTGSAREIRAERASARRGNGSAFWTEAIFYQGRRIESRWGEDVIDQLIAEGSCEIRFLDEPVDAEVIRVHAEIQEEYEASEDRRA